MRDPGRDGGPVELRCSGLVLRTGHLLVVGRDGRGDWVLPGGSPEPGEGSAASVRREVREETGVNVETGEVAFVFEVTDPGRQDRLIEIVFFAQEQGEQATLHSTEPGLTPQWVPVDELGRLQMRPPIAGYLRGATRRTPGRSAPLPRQPVAPRGQLQWGRRVTRRRRSVRAASTPRPRGQRPLG